VHPVLEQNMPDVGIDRPGSSIAADVLDELGSEVLPHFPTRSPSPDLDRSVRQEGEQQPLPVP
jgi:hypothetical protein